MPIAIESIDKISLFKGMSSSEILKMMSAAEEVRFKAGDVVVAEGEAGDALFVIQEGSVIVTKGEHDNNEVLTSLEAGEFFGEMALIDKSKRSATVVALESSILYRFSDKKLLQFADKEPGLTAKLYRNFSVTLASRLRRSSDKLQLLAKESKAMRSAVNQITSEIISVVSHEMRTPIAAIKGAAEVLDEITVSPDKQKNLLTIIQRHTLRLTGLFDDIVHLADIQAGGMQIEKEPGDITELIRKVVSELSEKATLRSVNIKLNLPPSLPKVPFHEKKLHRTLFHLMDNGINYNRKGGNLVISANMDKTEPQISISISDEGPGFPSDMKEELFKCFRQKTSSLDSQRSAGLGVGLPLARSLITAHGGTLCLESSPEGGSVFTFTLPLE